MARRTAWPSPMAGSTSAPIAARSIASTAIGPPAPVVIRQPPQQPVVDARYAAAADEIIRRTGVKDGYLPRPGLRRRQPGHRAGPANEPANLRPELRRPTKSPRSASKLSAAGPVRRARHRPPGRRRQRSATASTSPTWSSPSQSLDERPAGDRRRQACPPRCVPAAASPARASSGAMQVFTRAAAGQDRQLDASVFRPGQHELLDRRGRARASCTPCGSATSIWRCRSGTAAATRRCSSRAGCSSKASTPCGPSMPTTAATCGSSRCPAFRRPTTPIT